MYGIMTKADFARLACVTPPTIHRHVVAGGKLYDAVVGQRIDADHPAAMEYLRTRLDDSVLLGGAAVKEKKKGRPEDVTEYLTWTLRDILAEHGTDIQFLDYLKAVEKLEMIAEKRLRNATTTGVLIARSVVKAGILDPVETAHVKLLTDGVKTITQRVVDMHASGRDREDIEATVLDIISSHIKPIKAKAKRVMRDAAAGA